MSCGILHQAGQAAIKHALAKRLFQRAAATRGYQLLAGCRVHMLEHALAITDFRDKNHLHAQMFTKVMEDLAHVLVNQIVALIGGGQQQLADIDLQRLRLVIPSVNCHRSIPCLPFNNLA